MESPATNDVNHAQEDAPTDQALERAPQVPSVPPTFRWWIGLLLGLWPFATFLIMAGIAVVIQSTLGTPTNPGRMLATVIGYAAAFAVVPLAIHAAGRPSRGEASGLMFVGVAVAIVQGVIRWLAEAGTYLSNLDCGAECPGPAADAAAATATSYLVWAVLALCLIANVFVAIRRSQVSRT